MSEELDYMSDEFIKSCVKNSIDTRPGLLKTHSERKLHNLVKKKKQYLETKKKPVEVLQTEVLEESLKQPISSTNKGFSMLEKMGFKTGMGLGKNNSGIKEPIEISIKNNKMGLGHKTCRKPKITENKLDQVNENNFRALLSKKNREKKVISDLRKSQRICKELDIKNEKDIPEKPWFWLEEVSLKLEEAEVKKDDSDNYDNYDDEDDKSEKLELSYSQKLETLTGYLRDTYFYCIWCKVQYNDEKDLENCPGPTRDDH